MSKTQKTRDGGIRMTRNLRRRLETIVAATEEWDARRWFLPHLVIRHELKRPRSIFLVALTGVEAWKEISLPDRFGKLGSAEQLRMAGRVAREHYKASGGECSQFGAITGYALARAYDDWIGLGVDGEVACRPAAPERYGRAWIEGGGARLEVRKGRYAIERVGGRAYRTPPPGFAPLPEGLRVLYSPEAPQGGADWAALLLRHHFGPEALHILAPGEDLEHAAQVAGGLLGEGGRVVAAGQGAGSRLAIDLAALLGLGLLVFTPSPAALPEGMPPEFSRIIPTAPLSMFRMAAGCGPAPSRRKAASSPLRAYRPDAHPEEGLPGLLRDVEGFLNYR